ncbi:MAG: 3-hydroxyacyl-CoA dehydrogenase family protein [Chitinophagaceae bacterium]
MLQKIKKICICGAGTMGSGIAQVAAQSGFATILFDVNAEMIEKGKANVSKALQVLADKAKITDEQKTNIFSRINFTTKINDCIADIIIEAIVESKEAKINLFNQLAKINNNETIFATNTSSISVSSIAKEIKNASNVIGMHFFNPAPIMKLVEIIRGNQTNEMVVQQIYELAKQFNKTPVICKDSPGFIVNRVARLYYLEAMKLIELNLTDAETIDKIMEASGFKMGPFKLMDLIGLDVNFAVSNIVWQELDRPERLTPSTIQQQKVEAGELGRKSGKGFYKY